MLEDEDTFSRLLQLSLEVLINVVIMVIMVINVIMVILLCITLICHEV